MSRFIVLFLALAALTFTPLAIADRGGVAVYEPFSEILERHLIEKNLENDGLVSAFDYRAALDNPETAKLLARQRTILAEFDIDTLDSREQAIAFWLNAYNFFMIAQVLEEQPGGKLIDSVWDYGGRVNPFRANVFERDLFNVGGEKYSLDGMEKGILLGDAYKEKGWKEARVHFSVNCASVGCPPLRAEVYTPDNVDEVMTENTRRAFSTERHLRVDGDTLFLTALFDWYESHFVNEAGSVREFIKAHADDDVTSKVAATRRTRFIDYDWALNKPENFPEFND
jgi:hypothetical protein